MECPVRICAEQSHPGHLAAFADYLRTRTVTNLGLYLVATAALFVVRKPLTLEAAQLATARSNPRACGIDGRGDPAIFSVNYEHGETLPAGLLACEHVVFLNEVFGMAKVRISKGKFDGINTVADQHGVIAALAIDQRGSLKKSIAKAKGSDATDAELSEFKTLVSEVLTPYASAILLDPEYGLEASKHRAKNAGLLLAYEKTGYDASVKGRLPDLLSEWSVLRLIEAGADVIKILLYYDPDDAPEINTIKHAFVERVGAECHGNDVPFFLEPITYSDAIGNEQSLAFARVKPDKVTKYMAEFSLPRYGVDILKVEVPINMRYVEGSRANTDGQAAYTREEAKAHFRTAAAAARLPFIYLSAGVTDDVFRETLELAAEAGTPFSGVLCGRATWQFGVPEYGRGGPAAARAWLNDRGVQDIQALNTVLAKGAKPWWDFYGGLGNIEVTSNPYGAG
jgi:tagatose 1,6-diphosphate aldolase